MTVAPGSRLGPYEITEKLGVGGMGEVWRATDERLGREVALKVLPEGFADDPERHARFEREARVLASLNHPNIATCYGLEHLDDRHVLVMELVEGEGLDKRIARGPIPVDEAIPIALQIAEALEAAHEAGVVHRDLKPANTRIRLDGTVKVLDFGLAKTWESETAASGLTHSPTITQHHTRAGVILGTAAYMSPEQARGKPVDRRADIWAFGVVLWEMLTGRKLFEGETVSDVLAAVLRETPPLDALPAGLAPAVRRVVARCLERNTRRRLQWIGDARIELESVDLEHAAEPVGKPSAALRWPRLPWLLAAATGTAAGLLAALLLTRDGPVRQVLRFEIPPPSQGFFQLAPDNPGPAVVSPDGQMIAFAGRGEDGVVRLWVRALSSAKLRPLPGTEDARYPFWSSDSTRIGYFGGGKLRVVDSSGGPPLALCDAPDGKGGTWNEDGVIVFAPSYNTPLHRVSKFGGTSTPITELDADRGDNSHRHPRFLPNGHRFLYLARSPTRTPDGHIVLVGSLEGPSEELPLRSPANVEYASGHLLFPRERTLMASPFDSVRLRILGDAFPVVEEVALLPPGTLAGVYSASQTGVLVFQEGRGAGGSLRLRWRDRGGLELGVVGDPSELDEVRLLPDGRHVVLGRTEPGTGIQDLWLLDLDREVSSRFTFSPGFEGGVAPSPDGRSLYFSTESGGSFALQRKEIGGSGEGEVLLESDRDLFPSCVTPDGLSLLATWGGADTGYDIWIVPTSGDAAPYPLIQTQFAEQAAVLSPDGRWLAYESDESGRGEVYVTPFPGLGRKWQVSSGGGLWPCWGRGGREILYQAPDGRLMAVPVEMAGGSLAAGSATALFDTGLQPTGSLNWALSPDGERVLIAEPVAESSSVRLTVLVNWLEGRGRR